MERRRQWCKAGRVQVGLISHALHASNAERCSLHPHLPVCTCDWCSASSLHLDQVVHEVG